MISKHELIARQLNLALPDADVIVDVGFAQSPNPFLKGTIHGVDLMPSTVPEGYTATRVVDLNTDALPFADGTVDAVTMGCTLAHVANPLRVLGEIHRILRPNGVLIVSSPNPNYYWEVVLNVFYHSFKRRVSKAKHVEHFFEFSRYTMRSIAERAGFSVTAEAGHTFRIVKTPLRFEPIRFPGIAYEIVYTLTKTHEPQSFATYEANGEVTHLPTSLFGKPVSASAE